MISLADLQRRIESGDLSADAAIAQSLAAIGRLRQIGKRKSVPVLHLASMFGRLHAG